MRSVPFVQYDRVTHRLTPHSVEVTDDLAELAQSILRIGYRFECEHLQDGTVALSIHDTMRGEDASIEVAPNDPLRIKSGVERLIRKFSQKSGVV